MKAIYSLAALTLLGTVAVGQGAEEPYGGPRKPVIDNISAGVIVVNKMDGLMAATTDPTKPPATPGYNMNGVELALAEFHSIGAGGREKSPIDMAALEDELRIYPVPASTSLTIDLGQDVSAEIVILNVIGRQVYSGQSDVRVVRIDVSTFDVGTYFVSVKIGDQVITRRIQVTR